MPIPVWTSSKISSASRRSAISRSFVKNSGRKWWSPPSHWIGSIRIAAIPSGSASNAASISSIVFCSFASIPASSSPGSMYGDETRGQSSFGKYSVFVGSVFVTLSVYPLRPWNASWKCRILSPPPSIPAARFFRTFQSNAAFMAFSTASAPPAMKNR